MNICRSFLIKIRIQKPLIFLAGFVAVWGFALDSPAASLHSASGSVELSTAKVSSQILVLYEQFLSRHPGQWKITTDGRGILQSAHVRNGETVTGLDAGAVVGLLQAENELLGIDSTTLKSLRLVDTIESPSGNRYRFQAFTLDLEILWSTLTIHLDRDGRLLGIKNDLVSCPPLQSKPLFPLTEVIARLRALHGNDFISEKGLAILLKNDQPILVLKCFIRLHLTGYTQPVEMLCLADSAGEIIFRKPLSLPYRQD
jgi:hypothetical protein